MCKEIIWIASFFAGELWFMVHWRYERTTVWSSHSNGEVYTGFEGACLKTTRSKCGKDDSGTLGCNSTCGLVWTSQTVHETSCREGLSEFIPRKCYIFFAASCYSVGKDQTNFKHNN